LSALSYRPVRPTPGREGSELSILICYNLGLKHASDPHPASVVPETARMRFD